MHETTNVIKRSDLVKEVKDVVELGEADYSWLTPLSKTLEKRALEMVPKTFLLKDVLVPFETMWLVEEEQVGKIKITEYLPTCSEKRMRPRNTLRERESPASVSTIRFVLGDIVLEHFEGDGAKMLTTWQEIISRVIPVILYFQQFADKATVKQIKVTEKDGKKKTKILQNRYTLYNLKGKLPKKYDFFGKKYDVVDPKSSDLEDSELRKKGTICVIEHPAKIAWLQDLAEHVGMQMSLYKKKDSTRYPLCDKSRDLKAEISAVRCYSVDGKTYMQVNINKITRGIWQLNYYDEESDECQMVVLLNLEIDRPGYDIVFLSGEGKVTEKEEEYARRICNLLLAILVYLRIYSWEDAQDEDGIYYDCDIVEYPDSILGKQVKYF